MKKLTSSFFLIALLLPQVGFALGSCSIAPIAFGCSDPWGNVRNYVDAGCSIRCGLLQRPVCKQPSCNYFGNGFQSQCSCERVRPNSFDGSLVEEAN